MVGGQNEAFMVLGVELVLSVRGIVRGDAGWRLKLNYEKQNCWEYSAGQAASMETKTGVLDLLSNVTASHGNAINCL